VLSTTRVENVENGKMRGSGVIWPHISVVIPTFKREASLVRTVESIVGSGYSGLEINIIDMSGLGTDTICSLDQIEGKTGVKVEILQGTDNMYVSGAINLALPRTTGEFILLSSDDVVLEKNAIQDLVGVLLSHEAVGIVSPVCCYLEDKRRIWWAGSRFNMWTGRTLFYGVNLSIPDTEIFDSDTFTTLALIRKELFYEKNCRKPLFVDPNEFPMHYEEVDFSFRAKKKGWRICVTKGARAYHDIPAPDGDDLLRAFGVHTCSRAYFSARNRVLFHKKYSELPQFLVFVFVSGLLFMPYYSNLILLKSRRPLGERRKILKSYLRGFVDGLGGKPVQRSIVKAGDCEVVVRD